VIFPKRIRFIYFDVSLQRYIGDKMEFEEFDDTLDEGEEEEEEEEEPEEW
jgi:hypothetical protein